MDLSPEDSDKEVEWELAVSVRNGRPLVPVTITCPVCDNKVKRNPGTYTYECACGSVTTLEVPLGDTRRCNPKAR